MRITLAAIGKLKASPEAELIARYQKQLTWDLSICEYEAKKGLGGPALIKAEAALLLKANEPCMRRIALDERGKALGSEALAGQIARWQSEGCSHLGVMIGGADGLAPEVREAADLVLSFGTLTWPHMLARAMACEQLYRAQSILSGHPYHRA